MPQKNFTKKREPVWFTVGDDRYDCHPGLLPDDLKKLVAVTRDTVTGENAIEKIEEVFEVVMTPASFSLYQSLKDDRNRGFDHEQLVEIVEWLLETYTKRPTQSPSLSTTGSPNGDTGSGSTVGAPDTGSIQVSSNPTDS